MSNTRLETARQLIVQRDYEAARAILLTIPNDPTAQKWLRRIEEINPSKAQIPKRPSTLRTIFRLFLYIVVGTLVVFYLLSLLIPPSLSRVDTLYEAVENINGYQYARLEGRTFIVGFIHPENASLRARDKYRQIGQAMIRNDVRGLERIVLIYEYEGETTFTLTTQTNDVLAFARGNLSEEEFEVKMRVS